MNIHQSFLFSTVTVSVILNAFVLFLIVRFSSERIGSYKYLLFAYTLNAALYSTCQFGVLENWYVPQAHAGYLFFSSIGIFSRTIQIWIMTAFIGLFHMNLFIVCWSFLYRLTIFSQTFFFDSWRRILVLGLFTVFMEAFTIFDGWLIHPTEKSDEEYAELLLNITGRPIENVGYVGGPFMYDRGLNWNLIVAISVNGSVNACINCFIVFCWLRIRRRLTEMKQSSATTRLHYRLYILLSLQSLFPIIFNSMPVIFAFSFSALHLDLGNYMLLAGDCMNIAQIMDPICIIFFVADYKRAVLKMILGQTTYQSRIAPTTMSQKSNSRTGGEIKLEEKQEQKRDTEEVAA